MLGRIAARASAGGSQRYVRTAPHSRSARDGAAVGRAMTSRSQPISCAGVGGEMDGQLLAQLARHGGVGRNRAGAHSP
jgi:hypothetical protein